MNKEFSIVSDATASFNNGDAVSPEMLANAYTFDLVMMEAGSAVLSFLDKIAEIPKHRGAIEEVAIRTLGGAWSKPTPERVLNEISLAKKNLAFLDESGQFSSHFISNRKMQLEAGENDVKGLIKFIQDPVLSLKKYMPADLNLPDTLKIIANIKLTQTMNNTVEMTIMVGREGVEFFAENDKILGGITGGITLDDRLDDWTINKKTNKLETNAHALLRMDDFRLIQDILKSEAPNLNMAWEPYGEPLEPQEDENN